MRISASTVYLDEFEVNRCPTTSNCYQNMYFLVDQFRWIMVLSYILMKKIATRGISLLVSSMFELILPIILTHHTISVKNVLSRGTQTVFHTIEFESNFRRLDTNYVSRSF